MIREDKLKERDFRLTHSFIFIGDALKDSTLPTSVMPAGQYLATFSSKTLALDGSLGELYELERILDYAEHKGFEVCGNFYGESTADTPAFLFEERECLTKLNVPVRRKRNS